MKAFTKLQSHQIIFVNFSNTYEGSSYRLYGSDYHNAFPKYKMMHRLELRQRSQHLMGSRMARNTEKNEPPHGKTNNVVSEKV